MKRKRNPQHGFTLSEFALTVFVVTALLLFIYFVFLKKAEPGVKPIEKPEYKCLTSNSGFIPLKVVISNPDKAKVYQDPETRLASKQRDLKFFKIFFVFKQENGLYPVVTHPFSGKTLGCIKKTDGIQWSHREALELKMKPNVPVYIWENKKDIGDSGKAEYEQRTDVPIRQQYPILDTDGDRYQIALTWQTADWDGKGAGIGWTTSLKNPRDAIVVCYITRNELRERMDKLLATIKELRTKPYSDHPIIQLFKEDLGLTFGEGLNLEDESIGALKKMATEAPLMPEVFKKQPDEIRGELQKVWRTFTRLRAFYEDVDNWKKEGGGWIPLELLPGN
jgi:hypothetical protein